MKPTLHALHAFQNRLASCLPRRLQALREAMGLSNDRDSIGRIKGNFIRSTIRRFRG
jgi:hypothetical protein